MSNRPTVWMIAAALSLAPRIAVGQEHTGHQMAGETASVDPASCARGAQQALPVIERARTRLEAARQSNSPPELRAAIGDLQSALSELTAQLAPCAQPALGSPRQGSGQALPMPMDHSNMTMPMDHSRMAMPPAAPTPGTTKPSAGTPMPMDHSKMAMPPAAPKPGTEKPAANPGAAKLPVMPAERVLDPRCAKTIDPKTAPKATYQGKVYYFCSTADRDRFRRDPAAYLKKPPQ